MIFSRKELFSPREFSAFTRAVIDPSSGSASYSGTAPSGILIDDSGAPPAAIAAARMGMKTALIHDRPVLGGNGSDVNFRTDYWAFTRGPLVPDFRRLIDDFEDGVAPGTPCAPAAPPLNFCTFSGAGSSVVLANPATPPAPELPAVGTPNSVFACSRGRTLPWKIDSW